MTFEPRKIKIGYWTKDNITVSEKLYSGNLSIKDDHLYIFNKDNEIIIKFIDIMELKLDKISGIGTFIHIKSPDYIVNFSIPRINIADWFIINNYFETKKIYKLLEKKIHIK